MVRDRVSRGRVTSKITRPQASLRRAGDVREGANGYCCTPCMDRDHDMCTGDDCACEKCGLSERNMPSQLDLALIHLYDDGDKIGRRIEDLPNSGIF